MDTIFSDKPLTRYPKMIIPKDYSPRLDVISTARAVHQLKRLVEANLQKELQLSRVSAPLFVQKGTGINDDLNGVDTPVSFGIKAMDIEAEVVQSLAKWKRIALAEYGIPVHEGIYTDMHAIRPSEIPDNLHSVLVDQWDWEKAIRAEDRNLGYLRETVEKLFSVIKAGEAYVHEHYGIAPELPEKISFFHSEELLQKYPDLTPEQRESEITRVYGAVFVMGIGGELTNGRNHDERSPDYDDWSTPNSDGFYGLNGDILVWSSVLNRALELSSMGIRVDRESLVRQLALKDKNERLGLHFHQLLLNDELPLSIGGGIGQSRLGMYLLKKAHVGEISAGLWPEEMIHVCKANGIRLL
ncbi:MAG: aspartate--ammonia ligase [Chitinophagaceae bacterium]|nr:aspartate--ammonia ligase [Chitinophagaceae bacterium]